MLLQFFDLQKTFEREFWNVQTQISDIIKDKKGWSPDIISSVSRWENEVRVTVIKDGVSSLVVFPFEELDELVQ